MSAEKKKKRNLRLCPLRNSACIFEVCAWYDIERQRCILASLADAIDGLRCALDDLHEYLAPAP